ncbi:MAG: insulinase family protein [Candidatus Solibacter usitatus]|nr:insulinase family protein [Candidatus Solibacter usitatus]
MKSFLAILFLASALKAQTVDRTKMPDTAPLAPFKLPVIRESKLPNGLTVLLVRDNRIPLVTFRLLFAGGGRLDPASQPGLAETVASLLKEGTAKRSSRQFAEDLAAIGGSLDADSGTDALSVFGTVLSEYTSQFLDLSADVVRNALFPQDEIDLRKENRVQELALQRSQSATLADEKLHRVIFGNHPYARTLPTPQSIGSIERKDLIAYRDRYLTPGNAVLVLVGDLVSEPVLLSWIRAGFGSWPQKPVPPLPGGSLPKPARSITLIDRPGSAQIDIHLGRHTVKRLDPDYFPLVVASTILGGGASSRLFVNIREKQGYAYDASAHHMGYRDTSLFNVSTQVRDEVLEPALHALSAELDRMGKEPVSAQELSNMKNYLNGVFVLGLASQDGVASQLAALKTNGIPNSYLEQYVTKIRSVEPDQIQRTAAKYFSRDSNAVVIVGDASKIQKTVEKFGKVTVEKAN